MGAAASIVAAPTVLAFTLGAVSALVRAVRSHRPRSNPTVDNITEINRLWREKEKREREIQAARELADLLKRQAEVEAQQEEAERRLKKWAEEEERLRGERKRREAEEAWERESTVQEAEQAQEMESKERKAEAAIQKAEEEASQAHAAKEEAEEQLQKGIRPVVMPTDSELEEAKRKVEYREGLYHFAVAGNAGSGKSSLVNALCGLRNRDKGAAKTGIKETTLSMFRFTDPNPQNCFVWYDIPGAGTLQIPDWQYFNNQALYIFDAIIVLFDNRFTETDVAILRNARLFNIPCYIVRSKADNDFGYDSNDEQGVAIVRDHFVNATRKSVEENLRAADLPDQRVYIVSNSTLFGVTSDNLTKTVQSNMIDEFDFLQDLLGDAYSRRGNPEPTESSTRAARVAQAEAERQLHEGIQPVVVPSAADVEDAKRRIGYREGFYHFAVAGIAGSGKSSLINALRGLRNRDGGAAATGITETTLRMSRFPDSDPKNPFVWYDIPGAGTLHIRDWQYFNQQGLFVFDALVVLIDNRFTMTDVAILRNARLYNIPCYIVRSKADVHIRNVMREMGYDSEDEEQDAKSRATLEFASREHFVSATRQNVREILRAADLPEQRVYIISNATTLCVVKGNVTGRAGKKIIDELEFLKDLLGDAYKRRGGVTMKGSASKVR
ncbi:P-loop containing nucleoside triphosphate hydrolase protein [Coniophora puteana RWD-64-598 SS2]|uniref:p-loop containing nucleoside triphosphate hydrolase protein n=1 Tax=Coniophora puteana (strain RWD-64-598) TaxID=741705 RepID=R7SEK8_CONPW|nr:P-loop containing nucleoside triphosphate hydrolase protein [Coniophora puteana RWD-64-598 SS2]EIW74616.1 P-loop containing nucleoside triphosphate hydrolase protein [Coniophora puteana RWD-64-598 SS2]